MLNMNDNNSKHVQPQKVSHLIQRLAPELLVRVFEEFCDCDPNTSRYGRDAINFMRKPLVLTEICSYWRSLAIEHCPEIWTRILVSESCVFSSEIYSLYLKRSGDCLLRILFVLEDWSALPINTLREHRNRWGYLGIDTSNNKLFEALFKGASCPRLYSLDIFYQDSLDTSFLNGFKAPLLHFTTMFSPWMCSIITSSFPWLQITHLSIHSSYYDIPDYHSMFAVVPNLFSLEIQENGTQWGPSYWSALEDAKTRNPISFPFLKRLSIMTRPSGTNPVPIICLALRAQELEYLSIRGQISIGSDDEDTNRLFKERLALFSPRILLLEDVHFKTEYTVSWFSSIPSVRQLHLCYNHGEDVLDDFHVFSSADLLPRLETLFIECGGTVNSQRMLQWVADRTKADGNKLKYVSFSYNGVDGDNKCWVDVSSILSGRH